MTHQTLHAWPLIDGRPVPTDALPQEQCDAVWTDYLADVLAWQEAERVWPKLDEEARVMWDATTVEDGR